MIDRTSSAPPLIFPPYFVAALAHCEVSPMVGSYDRHVADLAFLFLTEDDTRHKDATEHEKRLHSLSTAIQQTIEDWIDSHPVDASDRRPS